MLQLRYLLVVLVVLGLVCAGLYVLWQAVSFIFTWIMTQQLQTVAAIITFAGTLVLCVSALIISQQIAKTRDVAESRRPEKTEIYTDFITAMVSLMRKQEGSGATLLEDSKKLDDFLTNYTTEVFMCGSPDVLRKYGVLSHYEDTPNPDPILIMDDLIKAMRKDLGFSTWSLARGELMKILLADPEKIKDFLTK